MVTQECPIRALHEPEHHFEEGWGELPRYKEPTSQRPCTGGEANFKKMILDGHRLS